MSPLAFDSVGNSYITQVYNYLIEGVGSSSFVTPLTFALKAATGTLCGHVVLVLLTSLIPFLRMNTKDL